MYFGIEQSTDLRNPQSLIVKFAKIEKKKVKTWFFSKINGEFTYANPDAAHNHHHTFRYIYEYDGQLIITKKEIEEIKKYSTSTYPIYTEDARAQIIKKYARLLTTDEVKNL